MSEKNNVGRKNDQDKPDLSLIPTDALWGMAAALTYGARKYDRHNFRNGIAYSRLVAATMRHLSAWNEGESNDPETSLSHIDHALASLAMLKFMEVNKKEMDDRYITEKNKIDSNIITPGVANQLTFAEAEEIYYKSMLAIQKRGR